MQTSLVLRMSQAYNQYMEDRDKKFMELALEKATAAKEAGDVPFGAVIIKDGQVIVAVGNSEHADQDVTKHAEMKAVSAASKKLGRDLSGCTIYTTVEPCPMCAGAIFHSCISRVVYGMSRDDLPHLFRTRTVRLWHLAEDWHYKPEVVGGVLKEQAIEKFLAYSQPFRVEPTQEPQLTDSLVIPQVSAA